MVLISIYPPPLNPLTQRIVQWAIKFLGADVFKNTFTLNIIKIIHVIVEDLELKNKCKEENESYTLPLHLMITTLNV